MLTALLHLAAASGTPTWAVLTASVGSGSVAGGGVYYQMRKLVPAQKKEMAATVQQMAVQTVETALKVARDRITTLESQVHEMTGRIGELRGRLEATNSDRARVTEELTLALIERAKLQQQIGELAMRLGHRNIDLIVPAPDAIVMMSTRTGEIEYANEGVFSLLGFVPSELVGRQLEILVPEAVRNKHLDERAMFAANPHVRKMGSGIDLQARTATGHPIDVDISLHPTGDGRVLALLKRKAPKAVEVTPDEDEGKDEGEDEGKVEIASTASDRS